MTEYKGHVDLFPGLWRTRLSMLKMQKVLRKHGYSTKILAYPSPFCGVKKLSQKALKQIRKVQLPADVDRFSVGHSLGCIITRDIMRQERIYKRAIKLGPPNGGNELIDLMPKKPWINIIGRTIFGPVTKDLSTDPDSYVNQLGPIDYPTGIIMGLSNVLPVKGLLPEGKNDGVVTTNSAYAHMTDLCDKIEIPETSHTGVMLNEKAIQQVLYYLEHERFNHPE